LKIVESRPWSSFGRVLHHEGGRNPNPGRAQPRGEKGEEVHGRVPHLGVVHVFPSLKKEKVKTQLFVLNITKQKNFCRFF
jgi:hypothetical protein